MLFQQLQKRNIDPIFIKAAICNFADSIINIRSSIITVQEEIPAAKRQGTLGPAERHRIAIEVCDTIWAQTKEHFAFTGHLVSSTLLHGELFSQHSTTFPSAALNATVEAYPMLNKARLKTELSLVYENPVFEKCSGTKHLLYSSNHSSISSTPPITAASPLLLQRHSSISSAPPETQQHLLCSSNSSISSAPPETQQHLLCSSRDTAASPLLLQRHSSISSAPPETQQHLPCSSTYSSIYSAPPETQQHLCIAFFEFLTFQLMYSLLPLVVTM
uniref:Uncharacterized protein n=1 Tax=Knipowitschia caucasica TaxID=637954 RepID=A0AAV2KPB8_KNICA